MRGRMLSLACLLAIAGAADASVPGPAIRFETLSLADGLSQSSVDTMLQDRQGFLWVGTQDGLNRYDGYGFLTYRMEPGNPSGLSSSYIRCLLEDRAGSRSPSLRSGGSGAPRHRPRSSASAPSSSPTRSRSRSSSPCWTTAARRRTASRTR